MEAVLRAFICAEIDKTSAMMSALRGDDGLLATTESIAARCVDAIRGGNKILFAGNGGSAADAQHLAAELVGRLAHDRPGLPALSLATDTSVLTAIANDCGYDDVFLRQVEALGRRGDVLVCLSTSGRSRNVIAALRAARDKGLHTVGMTGAGGGDMPPLCDLCLHIPSTDTQKIQEGHIVLGHIVCALIERQMFPRPA